MGMFLLVNAGLVFDLKFVYFIYILKKVIKKTKYIVFVGKGLTFDIGGYLFKLGGLIINMKFDMVGFFIVYVVFRVVVFF